MRFTTRILLALAATPVLAHAQTATPPPAGASAPPTSRKKVIQTGLTFTPDDQKLLGGYRLSIDKMDKFMAATKRLEPQSRQRAHALVDAFLDRIANA